MRPVPAAVPALAAALLASSGARADHACKSVDGPIVTTFTTDQCTSPVGICTVGTVQLDHEVATTRFTALTLSPGPTPDVLLYTGLLTITTRSGTITIQDSGMLDAATGQFLEVDQVVGGTRSYKKASGLLTSQGVATGTGFSGTLTGEICRVDS